MRIHAFPNLVCTAVGKRASIFSNTMEHFAKIPQCRQGYAYLQHVLFTEDRLMLIRSGWHESIKIKFLSVLFYY